MPAMINHTLGVVLVGGASRRMGIDKAAIDVGGVTLLERSVSVLSEVFSEVVVSGEGYAADGVLAVSDRVPGLGPMGGLDAVFAVAHGRAIFLLAVDMPFVDAWTVRAICEPEIAPMSVRVPVAAGRRQPLCSVYGSGLGPTVRRHLDSENRSMGRFFGSVAVEEMQGFDDQAFTNVNTVEDLDAAVKRFGRRRSTR